MSRNIKCLLIVFISSLLVSIFISFAYIPKANLTWDEAESVYWTYRIFDSLKKGDANLFWQATADQIHYPFFQSWVFGPLLLLANYSLEKLRIAFLILYILSSVLIYLIGKSLIKKNSELVGITASFLFITSPVVIFYSGLFMKEMMGVFLTLLVVFLFFTAKKYKKNILFLLTGILLLLLSLTKYNYGMLIAGILVIEGGIEFILSNDRRKTFFSFLLIFLPFIIGILFWVFSPNSKITDKPQFIIKILTDPAPPREKGSEDLARSLIYYPWSILETYSFSIIIGVFLLISYAFSLFYLKDFRIRLFFMGISINILLGISHFPNMQVRYIITAIPFLFILSGFLFSFIWDKYLLIKKRGFKFGIILGVFIILAVRIVWDFVSLPNFIYPFGAFSAGPIFNHTDYKDMNDFDRGIFILDKSSWPKKVPSGKIEKPSLVVDFVSSNLDFGKPLEVIYGFANEFSPGAFNLAFEIKKNEGKWKSLSYSSFVVTIEIFTDSKFFTNDYTFHNVWQTGEIRKVEKDPNLFLVAGKKFNELKVEAKVYGRK